LKATVKEEKQALARFLKVETHVEVIQIDQIPNDMIMSFALAYSLGYDKSAIKAYMKKEAEEIAATQDLVSSAGYDGNGDSIGIK
jgi:hypothetical protein